MQNTNAVVVVLGTGGTIAGTSAPGGDERLYQAAQLTVGQLLQAVPGLPPGLECEQVAQVDSKDMTHGVWHRLVARLGSHLARPEVAGVVVTHGTDTLEETAWFLQRVLAPGKPVVLTAAMRPATAAAPDGPGNLRDAVAVALDASARGVIVAMAGSVFAARDVRKAHTSKLDAFDGGDAGPLGAVADGKVTWLREVPSDRPLGATHLPPDVGTWPRVDLVTSHAGADGAVVDALRAIGAKGIVAVGTGSGTLHEAMQRSLHEAQAAGVTVWRATRCARGEVAERPGDFPGAGDLTPAKARIELMLALMGRT
ncbi:asparaginase [Piscinibacter gummiphilus]|uniref:L-asparaginase n=1 Tax=Piscinibacter gummiphilus TaxID=946333 RepID=A0A1W6L7J9_9BURK|nr:asparaginase [Piscinibacter gummiphilus]ARN20202.1 L-asparaginase [Piscinibacter gummiphilus]ATU64872.1 asparaginase [Piscinibacter gummiphilus]GLS96501.1 L-asparaginase [Piscinibacter gummiphilus]